MVTVGFIALQGIDGFTWGIPTVKNMKKEHRRTYKALIPGHGLNELMTVQSKISKVMKMCNPRKFGGFWNRHKWYNIYRTHRICIECGRTEERQEDSQGSSWVWCANFDSWKKSLESMKKWDVDHYPDDAQKALNWLKTLAV